MKIRQMILGLAAIAALAVAVPALATTHSATDHHKAPDRGPAAAATAKPDDPPAAQPTPPAAAASSSSLSFSAPSLSAADGARLARTGSLTLPIAFTGAATVSATGDASVGSATTKVSGSGPGGYEGWIEVPSEYTPILEPASVTARGAETADLTLTLNSAARAKLASGRDLELVLRLDSDQADPTLAMFVRLPGS
jgi:hypothetical protein